MKKIRFVKEYRAIGDFGMPGKAIIARSLIGDTADNLDDEDAQWLIDNGFAEEVKESGWWKPMAGDRYYFIDDSGYTKEATWGDNFWEVDRYKMGNVFKTEEAAERYRDYMEAIATVRQDEGVLTPEQVNERIKNEDLAYHVGYMGNRGNGEVLCGGPIDFCECWMPVGVMLFDSEAHVDRSLRKHPDEWKIIVNYDWSRE